MKKENLRALIVCALFGGLGFVLMILEFPLPMLIPPFIKLDFSEIPAIIVSFAYGPFFGVLVCLIKNLLHLFVTTSAGVGELSNFILGAIFVGLAGFVYRKNKSRKSALLGSLAGAVAMAVLGVITNYFIVYPAYTVLYGMPMPAIVGMYQAILPFSDNLIKSLVIFFHIINPNSTITIIQVFFQTTKRLTYLNT